jgi:hypothetical protein
MRVDDAAGLAGGRRGFWVVASRTSVTFTVVGVVLALIGAGIGV